MRWEGTRNQALDGAMLKSKAPRSDSLGSLSHYMTGTTFSLRISLLASENGLIN